MGDRRALTLRSPEGLALASVTCVYLGLVLVALSPDALYSGDIGVKLVQAQSLIASGFRSLALEYPAADIDPGREFFPFRPPFSFETPAGTQTIFPPIVAWLFAPFVWLGGTTGAALLSTAAGAVTLAATPWLRRHAPAWMVIVVVGAGTPIWFYSTLYWEHILAVACTTAAFAVVFAATPTWRVSAIAGVLLGVGAAIREESVLLLPALVLGLWWRHGHWRAPVSALAGAAAAFGAVVAADVWLYSRPAAAHGLHAVQAALTGAFPGAGTVEPEAALAAMTFKERWDTVVGYWLVTDAGPWRLELAATALAVAAMTQRWAASRWMALAVAGWLLAVSAVEWWALVQAPRWVAGLFRLSPFLIFALVPPAEGLAKDSRLRWCLLLGVATTIVVALLTVNTTGGKALGPRLLLPLVPLLAVLALDVIAGYVATRDRGGVTRLLAGTGVALVVVSLALQVSVMAPAWINRNHDDAQAIVALRNSPARMLIADDMFTAQLLFSLYDEKTIVLADDPRIAASLATRMRAAGIRDAVFITRRAAPLLGLPGFEAEPPVTVGRMVLQTWTR